MKMSGQNDKSKTEKSLARSFKAAPFGVLSPEGSMEARERLKKDGRLNRILPTRMARRYKPGDCPWSSSKKRISLLHSWRSGFASALITSDLPSSHSGPCEQGSCGNLKAAVTQSFDPCCCSVFKKVYLALEKDSWPRLCWSATGI